jgi:hypothetical protein
MLIVSNRKLSPVTLNDFCRRLDDRLEVAGTCAPPQRKHSTETITNNIRRKSLKSREFIRKIVKFAFFIALKLLTPVNYGKKKQI